MRDQLQSTRAMVNETNRNGLASDPHAHIDGQSIDQRANQDKSHPRSDTSPPPVLGRNPIP
jgi:hypothetical protein